MKSRLAGTLLLATLLILSSRPTTYARDFGTSGCSTDGQGQDAPTEGQFLTGPELQSIRQALDELALRRREVEALKSSISARDERIKILESILADQEKLVALWRDAAQNRKDANATDAKIEASYKESVERYAQEVNRLREDLAKAKRSRSRWRAIAVTLGGIVVTAIALGAGSN